MHPASLLLLLLLPLPLLGPRDAGWKRISPELDLSFPGDHGAHPAYQTEWWYLTGHLEGEGGRRFGFQFTVFRRGLTPEPPRPGSSPLRARQVLAGHFALTDVGSGRTRFAERLRRTGTPLARAAEGRLDIVLEDWSLRRSEEDRLLLEAAAPDQGVSLSLELAPRKPLVRHGDDGYSAKGDDPGNASAYVSWTRLAVGGRLGLDGAALDVRGEAWFDHEFGSSVLADGVVGWDWFGLQLADGRELMLFHLRRADGTFAPASAGTLVEKDGTARALPATAFGIEEAARWRSPRTAASYPARWTIHVPAAELRLEVIPMVADCELVTDASTGIAYWEGPVDVRGSVTGRGYAELTGYAGTMEGRF